VTAPKAVAPQTGIELILLVPPAPPPPPPSFPPPPAPATIIVSINPVPGCVVIKLGELAVTVVTLFFPNEVLFVCPIIPPFADPEGLAI
jgi:hypothetical protein